MTTKDAEKTLPVTWNWLGPVIMLALVGLLGFVGKLMYNDALDECADIKSSLEAKASKERVDLLEKRVESLERAARWMDRR